MQIIHKYFPDLTEKQIEQFTDLQELYEPRNAKYGWYKVHPCSFWKSHLSVHSSARKVLVNQKIVEFVFPLNQENTYV